MSETNLNDFLGKLGASEKAALRLLIDISGESVGTSEEKQFGSYPWAGVILFPKNIQDQKQVKNLIKNLQTLNANFLPHYPLLVSVDQEGGTVSPLGNLVTESPGNMALAAAGDLKGTYQLSRQMARDLRLLGFNVNFSPVVDVNTNPKNPIIGVRSFGENPHTVAKFAHAVIQGCQEQGIMATAKHFPGHGDTLKDSHLELPTVNKTRQELEKIHLFPFKKAVAQGVWGIMTAHVVYPQMDKKPATLSPLFLTKILRESWNFNGIIFTDSFEMAAMKKHFDLEEAVLQSIKAGADILLALGDIQSQLEIHAIVKQAIQKKHLTDEQIIKPLKRILEFKKKLGRFKPRFFKTNENISKQLHEKSTTILRGQKLLPLSRKLQIFLSPEATPYLTMFQSAFGNSIFIPWPWEKLLQTSPLKTLLFLGERRTLPSEFQSILRKFLNSFHGVVSFGNPYFLTDFFSSPIQIAAYNLNEFIVRKVSRILLKGELAMGKLPISL